MLAACIALALAGIACSDDACSSDPVETDEGLVYEDLECGDGAAAENGDTLYVHYTGQLEDGTVFDSSEGGPPLDFVLGAGNVIEGWDRGFAGMKVGGTRKLTIPPELGYGAGGFPPDIPPDATLIFEVELVDVRSGSS